MEVLPVNALSLAVHEKEEDDDSVESSRWPFFHGSCRTPLSFKLEHNVSCSIDIDDLT
jgi:hypothetical protein